MRKETEFDDRSQATAIADSGGEICEETEDDPDARVSTTGLIMKMLGTFVMVPAGVWFNFHAFMDISLTSEHWDPFGDTVLHYIVLALLPCLSHLGCLYVIISFWMDEECHTVMRTRTMWATIPLLVFYTCQMMGQSTTMNWLDCQTEALVQQVCYFQTNLWQTATVFTAYRFIINEKPPLQGRKDAMVHAVCWGLPILFVFVQTLVSPNAFHTDLFNSELRGIGWCGVDSTRRITKAIFVNTPQMICVSFYAQFYFYIHQRVDPVDAEEVGQTAKISTSRNASLLSLEEARTELYIQDTASQLRLQMSAYMLSFLTNTVVSLISDNLTDPDKGASDLNLLVQTGVVTCQGLLVSLVYVSTVNKPLLTAYWDTAEDLISLCSKKKSVALATRRARLREKRAIRVQEARRKIPAKPTIMASIANGALMFYQTMLLYPVAIWVWVPMDFISQNTKQKRWISIGLIGWSIGSVFPLYAFSLIGYRTSGMGETGMENMAQIYAVMVVFVSAIAVYANRYKHDLLVIERPCRYEGSLQRLFGPGQAFRFTSLRNVMSVFTLLIEFYQTWGLTWSATRMNDLYRGEYDSAHVRVPAVSSGSGEEDSLPQCTVPTGQSCAVFQFWSVVAMVVGWVILYSFPAVVTTSTVGNRQFAHNMQELYRKYLWFMSGAGFLTVLKACVQILFCIPNARHPTGPRVALTDHSIVCMSDLHLQMIAISLLCLAFFFPTATLTTLFRYGDEDARAFPPFVQRSCVLGGEDIRWIHLWRRVEYLVKGVWVFSGMRFAKYGNVACVVLLLGSLAIATANYFIEPSNLRFVSRQKLNIHLCNAWTTLTCLWAATVYNDSRQLHFVLMAAGWFAIWIVLWGYEFYLLRLNPFRKEIGDEENQRRCIDLIKHDKNYIMQASGIYRWCNHAKIVQICNLCEHSDLEIARPAFQAMCDLAFCDQMSLRYSFFLRLTSTHPTVNIMVDAIESSPRRNIQNLATRTLNSFLQTNTSNSFGLTVSFHETLQLYDDEKGGTIASMLSGYCENCEDVSDKLDAIQLILELCQSDSNDVPEFKSMLPMLNGWLSSGNLLQQYFATETIMYSANRFDYAPEIGTQLEIDQLLTLFQHVFDNYGSFQTEDTKGTEMSILEFGYHEGKETKAPQTMLCLRRHLPKKFKRMVEFQCPGDPTTDSEGDEMLGVESHVVLNSSHIKTMQADILRFISNALVDLAFAVHVEEKQNLLQAGVLDSVICRCLTFDATAREGADDTDRSITHELHIEACRLMTFLLQQEPLRQFHFDDEMRDYRQQLENFLKDSEIHNTEMHVFNKLTPMQRRKTHIVAEVMGLEHVSQGPPSARIVIVSGDLHRRGLPNPVFENENDLGGETSLAASQKSDVLCKLDKHKDAEITSANISRIANFRVVQMLQELSMQESTPPGAARETRYQIFEVFLQLIESRALPHDDPSMVIVRNMLLSGISNPSRAVSIMCCTGAHLVLLASGNYIEYGKRARAFAGKILFRKAARMIFWMIAWKSRARRGRKVADFSDIAIEQSGV